MSRAALHINDAGITLLDADKLLYRQPGFALLQNDELKTGDAAVSLARINPRHVQHRFWSELSTAGLKDQYFHHLSAADLVSHQLQAMWSAVAADIDELVVAVPPYLAAEQLGLLLGIAAELKLPVVGMVDAAVAATRREYRNAIPVHVDVSLHCTLLTRLAQDGAARAERSEILDGCGIYGLYDAWLTTIARTFVEQSRFDPLHTAATEQLLLNQLGAWLTAAGRGSTVAMEVKSGGVTHRAEIESLSLISAAAPWYQQIANRLRALYRADELPVMQMTERAGSLPGLAEMLVTHVGGEVVTLETGATARGALARCAPDRNTNGVTLLRQLAWDQAAIEVAVDAQAAAQSGVPTHLLFRNVAYAINDVTLLLGVEAESGARHIELPGDMPGISRQHCKIRRKNGQCIVEDSSRYGTFLNGHRIDGSTVLQIGDSLRVGTPGFEFLLITMDEAHGT
ncbi:MAG: FHA domain-containing protein [Woeseia sp.]|nr:FHA domain-containing protein [Woeseia sp.]MBT8097369.1 FHA domain-containing protein [Woeseia sp.]NNE62218.1 FHA domain-containing protein [Woeseia sp.]NNL54851.1 FHA domain-containing protein [Woeseia sp.]